MSAVVTRRPHSAMAGASSNRVDLVSGAGGELSHVAIELGIAHLPQRIGRAAGVLRAHCGDHLDVLPCCLLHPTESDAAGPVGGRGRPRARCWEASRALEKLLSMNHLVAGANPALAPASPSWNLCAAGFVEGTAARKAAPHAVRTAAFRSAIACEAQPGDPG